MQRLAKSAPLSILIMALAASAVSAAGHRATRPRAACRVPSLTGITLAQAQVRAARAHCKLRIDGGPLERADVQTVTRQSPAASRRSAAVTVWLNPFLCRVPELTGLTVSEAATLAARAGCTVRIEGAPLKRPDEQTVERQSPEALELSASVTLSVNPLCAGSAAPGPGIDEPMVTQGPTELVSGFFLAGGPLRLFSTPGCALPEIPSPGAGSVEVMDAGGALVATATSTPGHFVEIALPAGSYTIRGTFLQAFINGVNPSETKSVEIPPGDTVRQDFVLDVP